ncbi:MAG TPA: prepilin-type N-terminal cleavage/methylation domain-containing protein, partial [Candidatus Binatia bacterium]|nr:prepilin-type N-terminal cleavage/methylation domain-containing protein [Candidatus Binatia bacterium]
MIRKNEKGFTLIELLVVIAIIGILAAIAIPQFASYRKSAFCSGVESDVTNTVIALEGGYAQTQKYDAANKVETAGNKITPTVSDTAIDTVVGTNPNCDLTGHSTFTFDGTAGTYTWS